MTAVERDQRYDELIARLDAVDAWLAELRVALEASPPAVIASEADDG